MTKDFAGGILSFPTGVGVACDVRGFAPAVYERLGYRLFRWRWDLGSEWATLFFFSSLFWEVCLVLFWWDGPYLSYFRRCVLLARGDRAYYKGAKFVFFFLCVVFRVKFWNAGVFLGFYCAQFLFFE